MTIQSKILISKNNNGLRIIDASEKKLFLPKKCISEIHEEKLRTAISIRNSRYFAEIINELFTIMKNGEWNKAPNFYTLKHIGYYIGKGMLTRKGVMSDLSLIVRTRNTVLYWK